MSDISVVVCTKNNAKNIERVLRSIVQNHPLEVIVVDGGSTDGTRNIVQKFPVKMLTDPGKGLALARQIALKEVKGKYTCFVGDDNIIKKGSLEKQKQYIIDKNWCGGAWQTRIIPTNNNYWEYCTNIRWKVRFTEGERRVIGTPYIFETTILKASTYDENCSFSDDSDIAERIPYVTDKKLGYSDLICYEVGKSDFKQIKTRFIMYGKSDAEYWKKYKDSWSLVRKIQSVLHPFKDEFLFAMVNTKSLYNKIYSFPFFALVTIIRYKGWIEEGRRILKRNI